MKDLIECSICGSNFNAANLSEVVKHEHINFQINEQVKSKKVIKHASEVYPYCSGEFYGGVHSFLEGDDFPTWPSSNEYKAGYISAQRDLKDNYKLEF